MDMFAFLQTYRFGTNLVTHFPVSETYQTHRVSPNEVVLLFRTVWRLIKDASVSVYTAFRVSAWPKYARSGVHLSSAV